MRHKQTKEYVLQYKSRDFPDNDVLVNFMQAHLYELYDEYKTAEGQQDESLMDYIQGSIDTTHVYLYKSGVTPIDYEAYQEKVGA